MKTERNVMKGLLTVEIEAVKQLRQNLKEGNTDIEEEKLCDDEYLMRWLTAKNLDVTKAEKSLVDSLKWRKENNLESPESTIIPEDYYTKYPYYLDGEDKDGRIVISYSCGPWDIPTILANGEHDTFFSYAIQMFARAEAIAIQNHKESVARGEKRINCESVWIIDVAGSPMRNLTSRKTLALNLELMSAFDKNFPEFVHRCYFINASNIFAWFFKLIKQFISARTMSKVELLGSDRSKWKPVVLENINPDQIRPAFGGTKEIKFTAV